MNDFTPGAYTVRIHNGLSAKRRNDATALAKKFGHRRTDGTWRITVDGPADIFTAAALRDLRDAYDCQVAPHVEPDPTQPPSAAEAEYRYRKTRSGEWVACGPVAGVQPGSIITVTTAKGERKQERVESVGRPFDADGIDMAYLYLDRLYAPSSGAAWWETPRELRLARESGDPTWGE